MALKVKKDQVDDQTILEFSGSIDEDANLPSAAFNETKEVIIDFKDVEAINSCGIREWIKWLAEAPEESLLIYKNCQRSIVDQLNMVDGFIPKNGRVDSFYVPYFCEECEHVTSLLMIRYEDFSEHEIDAKPETACEKCKQMVELDVTETKYFNFLKT